MSSRSQRPSSRSRPASSTSATSTSVPADGPAVVLLHGWPYDIHTFAEVSPRLAAAGYRVIVPYLRGYGTTRFLSDETFRNGQQSVLAVDTVALMDALGIEQAVLAGADWGARTADIVAALWPERCCRARLGERLSDRKPAGRRAAVGAGGRAAVVVPVLLRDRARPGRVRALPARVREAHLADGLAAVGLRRRHVRAQRRRARQPGSRRDRDPQLPLADRPGRRRAAVRRRWSSRLAEAPVINVPTITLEGDANGAPHPDPSSYAEKFSGPHSHRTITGGIGHNLPQEAPEAFAQAVIDVTTQ